MTHIYIRLAWCLSRTVTIDGQALQWRLLHVLESRPSRRAKLMGLLEENLLKIHELWGILEGTKTISNPQEPTTANMAPLAPNKPQTASLFQ